MPALTAPLQICMDFNLSIDCTDFIATPCFFPPWDYSKNKSKLRCHERSPLAPSVKVEFHPFMKTSLLTCVCVCVYTDPLHPLRTTPTDKAVTDRLTCELVGPQTLTRFAAVCGQLCWKMRLSGWVWRSLRVFKSAAFRLWPVATFCVFIAYCFFFMA